MKLIIFFAFLTVSLSSFGQTQPTNNVCTQRRSTIDGSSSEVVVPCPGSQTQPQRHGGTIDGSWNYERTGPAAPRPENPCEKFSIVCDSSDNTEGLIKISACTHKIGLRIIKYELPIVPVIYENYNLKASLGDVFMLPKGPEDPSFSITQLGKSREYRNDEILETKIIGKKNGKKVDVSFFIKGKNVSRGSIHTWSKKLSCAVWVDGVEIK